MLRSNRALIPMPQYSDVQTAPEVGRFSAEHFFDDPRLDHVGVIG
jgi:hypothetical protein